MNIIKDSEYYLVRLSELSIVGFYVNELSEKNKSLSLSDKDLQDIDNMDIGSIK